LDRPGILGYTCDQLNDDDNRYDAVHLSAGLSTFAFFLHFFGFSCSPESDHPLSIEMLFAARTLGLNPVPIRPNGGIPVCLPAPG
jgi:hypothetical protein